MNDGFEVTDMRLYIKELMEKPYLVSILASVLEIDRPDAKKANYDEIWAYIDLAHEPDFSFNFAYFLLNAKKREIRRLLKDTKTEIIERCYKTKHIEPEVLYDFASIFLMEDFENIKIKSSENENICILYLARRVSDIIAFGEDDTIDGRIVSKFDKIISMFDMLSVTDDESWKDFRRNIDLSLRAKKQHIKDMLYFG